MRATVKAEDVRPVLMPTGTGHYGMVDQTLCGCWIGEGRFADVPVTCLRCIRSYEKLGAAAVVTCPRCGSTDKLSLTEVHEEIGTTWAGTIRRDASGDLIPPTKFEFEYGDPISVAVTCEACGHHWKPRRTDGQLATVSASGEVEWR